MGVASGAEGVLKLKMRVRQTRGRKTAEMASEGRRDGNGDGEWGRQEGERGTARRCAAALLRFEEVRCSEEEVGDRGLGWCFLGLGWALLSSAAPRVCLELCGLARRGGREEARRVRARARSHAATGRCTFALCAMICTVQADGHREHLDEATRRDGAPCLVVDTFLLYY